ncbi:MAG: TssN family type VI secretion system protein [Crocinitomicaceae bacterium]|nr:TssN family type VI secretion system protein [Crocinitomicaceae bacterium]
MDVLVIFFLQYLLAPMVALACVFLIGKLSKGRAMLNSWKLIIFILVTVLLLVLPSLIGAIKFEFVWFGLYLSIIIYLFLGAMFNLFMKTKMFKAIGLNEVSVLVVLVVIIITCLTAWIYYLLFDMISDLDYSAWTATLCLWFLVPLFYVASRKLFLKIPAPFYKSWVVERDLMDDEYWDNVDTFSLMQVTVKIKRTAKDSDYSSFSVKLPKDVTLGRWFNRFIEDQNIRFPNRAIEIENEDQQYGWIFYTSRWLSMPIFTRMLDFDKEVSKNRIRNKSTLYVRRVLKDHDTEEK